MPPTRRAFLSASTLTALSYSRVAGANERIGLGFIGYGLMGKGHVATFRQFEDVSPRGLAEVHRGRLAEGCKALGEGVRGHADFRKLLDDREIQAVVISTPDHWHALMTMLACAAGKDVYVEKPMTLFVREGQWMMDVAARNKSVVQVGTQQRSGPHYQRARDLIRGGHIGQVVAVRMVATRNIMPGFGSPEDADPPIDLDWDRWLGPAPRRDYNPNRALYHFRWFWDYSGGQMTNLGAHMLDIVDWTLGLANLKNVCGMGGRFALTDNGETPDTQEVAFAAPRYVATFSMRECAIGTRPEYPLEFIGTDGSLGISRAGFAVSPDPSIPAANQVPGVKEGHPVGGPRYDGADRPQLPRTGAMVDASGSSAEQYRRHARDFLDCIKSREVPISDVKSGHRTAVACHLGNLSTRLGRSLRWDPRSETVIGDAEANSLLVRAYRAPWDRELRALGVVDG